jgi:hypothetical protein
MQRGSQDGNDVVAAVQAEIDRGNRLPVQLLLSRKRDSLRPFRLEDDLVFFRKPLCFHAEQHENRAIFADVFCDFFRKIKAQHDFWPDTT